MQEVLFEVILCVITDTGYKLLVMQLARLFIVPCQVNVVIIVHIFRGLNPYKRYDRMHKACLCH